MTSKNWFLVDSLENLKRRDWLLWLQFMYFFACIPGFLILGFNNLRGYETLTQERLDNLAKNVLLMNGWMSALIVTLAILVGVQGFSWLHDKNQVNFYHSQPVSRNRRFLVIWWNGIASFFAAYLLNLFLGVVTAGTYGCVDSDLLTKLPSTILGYGLLFLSVYHITIMAVMLTGNTLVSLLMTGVLLSYEVALRGLLYGYTQSFFRTYAGNGWGNNWILDTFLSPLVIYFRYLFSPDGGRYARLQYSYGQTMLALAALSLLFGVAGWLLYRKRASESHGKSISYPVVKEPLRLLLLFLAGLFGGWFVYAISFSKGLGIGGAAFTVLIGHGVLQLIYEMDFRAVRKKIPGLLLSLFLVTATFLIYESDLLGYDRKIPNRNRVESYSVVLEERLWDTNRVLSDGTQISSSTYIDVEMELTDIDLLYRFLEKRLEEEEVDMQKNPNIQQMYVLFRMKNGKNVQRRFYFDKMDNLDVFQEIFQQEEYQKTTNQVMEDGFIKEFRIYGARYNNGLTDRVVPSSFISVLTEAYVQDVKEADIRDLYYDTPIGMLLLKGKGLKNTSVENQWKVVIYPTFSRTIKVLEEAGLEAKMSLFGGEEYGIESLLLYYYSKGEEGMRRKHMVLASESSPLTETDFADQQGFAGLLKVEQKVIRELLEGGRLQWLDNINNYRYETGKVTYEVEVVTKRYEVEEPSQNLQPQTSTSYETEERTDHNENNRVYYVVDEEQLPQIIREKME